MLGKTKQAREMILGNVTCWMEDFDALTRALFFRHAIDFHTHQVIVKDFKSTLVKNELSNTH